MNELESRVMAWITLTLLIILITLKITTYRSTVNLLAENAKLMETAKNILKMVQIHASITDSTKERVDKVIKSSTEEVKQTIEKVPDATVEKLTQQLDNNPH